MAKTKKPTKPKEDSPVSKLEAKPDIKIPPNKKDSFTRALDDFIGEIVEVTNLVGDKTKGKCLAITKNHLNIIIDAVQNVIIIKNISSIRREKK